MSIPLTHSKCSFSKPMRYLLFARLIQLSCNNGGFGYVSSHLMSISYSLLLYDIFFSFLFFLMCFSYFFFKLQITSHFQSYWIALLKKMQKEMIYEALDIAESFREVWKISCRQARKRKKMKNRSWQHRWRKVMTSTKKE